MKSGLIDRYSKPAGSMAERFEEIWADLIDHNNNFDYKKSLLTNLKHLSQRDFIRSVFYTFHRDNLRRATIYIRKAGLKKGSGLEQESTIEDIQKYQNGMESETSAH